MYWVFLWTYSSHYCPSNSKDLMMNHMTFMYAPTCRQCFLLTCSFLNATSCIRKIQDTRDFVFSQEFWCKLSGKLCIDLYVCISDYCALSLIQSFLLTVGCHISCHARDVEQLGSTFREKQALYIVICRYITQCKFACQFIHSLGTVTCSLSQVCEWIEAPEGVLPQILDRGVPRRFLNPYPI